MPNFYTNIVLGHDVKCTKDECDAKLICSYVYPKITSLTTQMDLSWRFRYGSIDKNVMNGQTLVNFVKLAKTWIKRRSLILI